MSMQWSEKLATGVATIDEQHRNLFEWFSQLESAAADQRMMTAAYALTRLTQYTRSHFEAEEELMAASRYPRLAAHREEHEAFRLQLRELQNQSVTRDISGDAVTLLRDWLVKHIMVSDMDYVPYARGPSPGKGEPAH